MKDSKLVKECKKAAALSSHWQGGSGATPYALAVEMVSKIPEDIIKNPNSKFLDPCAGVGTFGAALLERLVEYHSEEFIINEMIHLVEISALKVILLKKVGFKNVMKVDSLERDWNMKFDVVIGNPPYNTGEVGKNKTIYHQFIELGCNLSNSISIMVTPGGYITSIGNKFSSTVEAMNSFGVSEIVYKDSKEIWPNLTIMDLNYSVLNVNSSNKVEDFKIVDERIEAIKAEAVKYNNHLQLLRGGQAYEHSDCTSEDKTEEFNTPHITRVNKEGPYKMYSNKPAYDAEYMVVMSERFSGPNPANVTVVKGDYSLSCNVIALAFKSKGDAIRMAEYLTSKEIQPFIEAYKGLETNPFKLGTGRLIPDLTKEQVDFTLVGDYTIID